MRVSILFLLLLGASASAEPYHLIPGRVPLDWQGPDGNTVILDARRA